MEEDAYTCCLYKIPLEESISVGQCVVYSKYYHSKGENVDIIAAGNVTNVAD